MDAKESDDTSSDVGDDRCRDCGGFQVQELKDLEDHEHCVGNEWICGGCGKDVHTTSEAKTHMKGFSLQGFLAQLPCQ